MNTSMVIHSQLLATKFFMPVASRPLVPRPRLTALLDESLKHPFILISAPAGFGKTTAISVWAQSLPASTSLVAWVSLSEEDNEPLLFWTSIIVALDRQKPECFTPLLMYLQSQQAPPLKYVSTALVNLLAESAEHFVLILDDYHVITERHVHTSFSYFIEHLPPQLRIILVTRADPPLSLTQLRARRLVLEVRTNQLRCTAEETDAFFRQEIGIQLPEETIQEVATRLDGWLVGLQLLSLSLPEQVNPATLLQEVSGDQRYILDYLTEEVLRLQPQEVQNFLLSTCILDRLNASLCDAIIEQEGSQQMLAKLEHANLFIESLDSKHHWYRYHALFAEALRSRLEQTSPDRVSILHQRASLWYAQQGQTTTTIPCKCETLSCQGIWQTQQDQSTSAVLHALKARQWQWAADLIERLPIATLTWGVGEPAQILFRHWLGQLPADIVHSRPRLCLACAQLLWGSVPYTKLQSWLDVAEATLTASLTNTPSTDPLPQMQQEEENLLGEVIAFRALLKSYEEEDGLATQALCQRAVARLSAQNYIGHTQVAFAQLVRCSTSSAVDDVEIPIKSALQAGFQAQAAGNIALAIGIMSATALYMIELGQLRKAHRLTQRAIRLGTQPRELVLPEVGWPALLQAEILREWNQLDEASSLLGEAIVLCQQTESTQSQRYLLLGYAIQLRIALSNQKLDTAHAAFQNIARMPMRMNYAIYLYQRSIFTTIDQIRLWIASGELERATRWAQELSGEEQQDILSTFIREREEVARVRVYLAQIQADLALQQLEPLLQRATAGQRWGHVMEMRILQALAHQMQNEEPQALSTLAEAVRLAERDGYIRSFVEEGAAMGALLSKLREQQCKAGPTPYLDTMLAAFPVQEHQPKLVGKPTNVQSPLQESLSERELEVLQLLANGASNQQIAQELVITLDTVKRHVSHIFSKLNVQNRVQATKRSRSLGLLKENP